VIAAGGDPAHQHDFVAEIRRPQGAAGVSSFQVDQKACSGHEGAEYNAMRTNDKRLTDAEKTRLTAYE
jgi:hypothetical protein